MEYREKLALKFKKLAEEQAKKKSVNKKTTKETKKEPEE
tara:strand:- start:925 stop:1041 length:117 start_codon:yes stop_codon:yes gene_type:complete